MSNFIKNVEKSRNTPDMFKYYSDLEKFLKKIPWTEVEKSANFPVLAQRQAITKFLERYELFKLIHDVPGSILECGVANGFGLMSFAHLCSIFEGYHYTRKLFGFDTFEGFTQPNIKDKTSSAQHMKKHGLKFPSYEILKKMVELYDRNRVLGHLDKVELIKGDISKTLPKFLKKNPQLVISLLYLDLDLYKPTKDSIRLLLKRIPKGGIIGFDELNHTDYPGETIAVMEEIGISNLKLKRLNFASMSSYAVI